MLENARKCKKIIENAKRAKCKNFICLNFINLKVDIFFVTLNKINIL